MKQLSEKSQVFVVAGLRLAVQELEEYREDPDVHTTSRSILETLRLLLKSAEDEMYG